MITSLETGFPLYFDTAKASETTAIRQSLKHNCCSKYPMTDPTVIRGSLDKYVLIKFSLSKNKKKKE